VADAQASGHHDRTPVALTEMRGVKIAFTAPNAITIRRAQRLFSAEPETIVWLDNIIEPDSVLCDIGANVGTYSLYAAIARKARVFAFEPASQNFALLNANIVANGLSERVLATCLGLSDTIELTRMFLSGVNPGNAMHAVGDNRDFKLDVMAYSHVQGCMTMTLDHLVESGAMPCPTHMKIDVDGFEHKVIEGARRTLADRTLKSLLVELNINLPEHVGVITTLEALGFHHAPRQAELNRVKDGMGKGLGNIFFFRSPEETERFADMVAAAIAAPPPDVSVSLLVKP
jgi:FkbM family methyltransferase